jgi:hypothetical protein
MKFKTLVITLLFAVSMWAQNAVPAPADQSANTKATASCCKDGAACCKDGANCCRKDKMAKGDCCKDGAACCKDGAACCGKGQAAKADCCKEGASCCKEGGAACCGNDKMAQANAKGCCGGKMCKRHKA